MGKRTTLILDEELIRGAMEAAGTRSKTETVHAALRELIRSARRQELRRDLGTYTSMMTADELREMRNADWPSLPDR